MGVGTSDGGVSGSEVLGETKHCRTSGLAEMNWDHRKLPWGEGVALQTEKMDVVAETALFPHNPFPLPPGDTALLNLPPSLSGGSGLVTEFWLVECGQHRTMKFRGRAVR